MNRIHNASNPHQGAFKKVLCVCSAGLLRSPTAAWVLSQEPYGYNTRAAGIGDDYALVCLDAVLISWCDEVVVMNGEMALKVLEIGRGTLGFASKRTINLEIPDDYAYRDEKLIALIKQNYAKAMV